MNTPADNLELVLKLRLAVARFGEMDGAGWWNTLGILGRNGRSVFSRGFPATHALAQARVACAVAGARCSAVFAPPNCWTLWALPAEIEDALNRQWPRWCRDVDAWTPFFAELAPRSGGDLLRHLRELGLVDDETVAAAALLRCSAEGKAVALPGFGSPSRSNLMLLAAGFAKGEKQRLAVPYLRSDS